MKIQNTIVLASALALTACGTAKDDDGDDTGVDTSDTSGDTSGGDDTGTPTTLSFSTDVWDPDWSDFVDCGTADVVTFDVEATGEGIVALYMEQTTSFGTFNAHNESHTLSVDQTGTGFATYSQTLATGATLMGQTSDTDTLWDCSDDGASLKPDAGGFQVTFALAIFPTGADVMSDTPDDCILFGQDTTEILEGTTDTNNTQPAWVTSSCTALN